MLLLTEMEPPQIVKDFSLSLASENDDRRMQFDGHVRMEKTRIWTDFYLSPRSTRCHEQKKKKTT